MSAHENPKKSQGDAKVPLHLLTPAALEATARVMAHGARKYGPFNWRTTRIDLQTYIGATLRHLTAIMNGEDIDPDSHEDHWAHISANCNVVLDSKRHNVLDDNRPPTSQPLPPYTGWMVQHYEAYHAALQAHPDYEWKTPPSQQHEDWGDVNDAELDAWYQGK